MPARVFDPSNPPRIAPGTCALGVMTKAPAPGKVKTRLTPPLTAAEAADLNTCFLRDTAAALTCACEKGGAMGIGVYTPQGAENAFDGILPEDFMLVPQRGEPFGERLRHAIEDLLRIGFDAVCLIDSDSPTVPYPAYIEAVRMLQEPGDRVVIGPSDDGGYYLIGMKTLHAPLFENIEWSTERVLSQTHRRAATIGVPVHLLSTWYDVDDRATLRRLCDELLGADVTRAPSGFDAVHTREYLAGIIAREGRARIWPV